MSSSSSIKKHRRKWTKDQLLKNLEILGTLAAPLPPTLPPSPPASRSSSPAPLNKRKADPAPEQDSNKRPRTNNPPERHPTHLHQHRAHPPTDFSQQQYSSSQTSSYTHPAPPSFNTRNEPAEDGEVREDPVLPSSSSSRPIPPEQPLASAVPIRRPKRGRPSTRHFDQLHDKYHNAGRMLKYSGDARFWSTYPVTHKEYRPLPVPLSPNSPYHKYGGLIARLELVDALVCFTYSIWNKDYSRRNCQKEYWSTIEAFLVWCKQKWQAEEGINDAEKAFLGLIWMIEAFIHGRKVAYLSKTHLDADVDKLALRAKSSIETAVKDAEANPSGPSSGLLGSSQSTPPMLPSPASIAPASSANSTPTTRAGDTPSTHGRSGSNSSSLNHRAAPSLNTPLPVPYSMLPPRLLKEHKDKPLPSHILNAVAAVTVDVGPTTIQELKDTTSGIKAASYCMSASQNTLTLPVLARLFPNTFARMMYSTLSANEEHEPDIEDEEGELFWPGQLITGEGLGWVCLMGKAMIKEFGKAYGYKGLDGVVPKPATTNTPEPSAEGGNQLRNREGQSPRPNPSQASGATPQGRSTPQYVQR